MRSEQRLRPASVLFSLARAAKAFALPGLLLLVSAGRTSGGRSGTFGRLPENWELQWRCRDLREHVKWLEMQLRNDISPGDVNWTSLQPKTALERSLEKKILELEGKIHNPKGRGRSSSM